MIAEILAEHADTLRRVAPSVERSVTPGSPWLHGYEWYDQNLTAITGHVEQTPRARALRQIVAIAARRGWGSAITTACDRAGVTAIAELSDADVASLHAQMEKYLDAAHVCCDLEDEFPAR